MKTTIDEDELRNHIAEFFQLKERMPNPNALSARELGELLGMSSSYIQRFVTKMRQEDKLDLYANVDKVTGRTVTAYLPKGKKSWTEQ